MAIVATLAADPVAGNRRVVVGDRKVHFGVLALDKSYVTGGYALTPAMFGFDQQLDYVDIANTDPAGTRLYAYDKANSKLKVFTALGAEAANASDQSAFAAVPFIAWGK